MKATKSLTIFTLLVLLVAACTAIVNDSGGKEAAVVNATVFFVNSSESELCEIKITSDAGEIIIENLIEDGEPVKIDEYKQARLQVGIHINVYIEACDGNYTEGFWATEIMPEGFSYYVGGGE